jgi:hypothetical protein
MLAIDSSTGGVGIVVDPPPPLPPVVVVAPVVVVGDEPPLPSFLYLDIMEGMMMHVRHRNND